MWDAEWKLCGFYYLGHHWLSSWLKIVGLKNFAPLSLAIQWRKAPQLFAKSSFRWLQPLCISSGSIIWLAQRDLDSQPREIEAMKAREPVVYQPRATASRKGIVKVILPEEANQVVPERPAFGDDFRKLQSSGCRLDELLWYLGSGRLQRCDAQPSLGNATAFGLLFWWRRLSSLTAEGYFAVESCCKKSPLAFFQRLMERVCKSEYYSHLSIDGWAMIVALSNSLRG